MALLSKDQILGADDRKEEIVPVPEWGGEVRMVGLTGADRDSYEGSFVIYGPNGKIAGRNMANARAKLVARCIVDEDGTRMFTDAEVKALGDKNGAVLDRLFDKARDLSGMREDAVAAKAGNSDSGQSEGSTSA